MRILSPLVFGSLTALSCIVLAPGCSDDEGSGEPDGSVDVDRKPDAGDRDARADGSRDATADARQDAAEPTDADVSDASDAAGPPEPGSPCSPSGAQYERACGSCGLQVAACANGVVTGYGACNERHPAFCQSDAGTDGGTSDSGIEDAGPVDASTDAEDDASAPSDAGDDASDAGEPVDPWEGYAIDIDGAVGQSRSVVMAAADGQRRRISVVGRRTCPAVFPGLDSIKDYALVRIRNRTAQAATLELSVTRGLGPTDTILAVYPTPPETDAELLACLGTADRDSCPDPEGTAAQRLSCLQGVYAPVVPAGAEIYAYVSMALDPWNGPGLRATLTNLQ